LSTEGAIFINHSTVRTVRTDSHSLADTVDTDCLSVPAVNRCYCRQINWQLLTEQQSECQNVTGCLIQVQNRICPAQELTPQTTQIPQPFYTKFQGLFCVRPTL